MPLAKIYTINSIDFIMLISFDFAKLQLKFVFPNFLFNFLQKRKPTELTAGLKEVRQNYLNIMYEVIAKIYLFFLFQNNTYIIIKLIISNHHIKKHREITPDAFRPK